MHRVALIVPINKEKRILLQHRDPDILIKPNHWAFFGGHIEGGESSEDAAKREFQEELGIEIVSPKFFKHDITQELIHDKKENVERFFYIVAFDGDEKNLKKQLREGDNLGFFSRNELETLCMASNDREICYEIFDIMDTLL